MFVKKTMVCETMEGKTEDLKKIEVCGKSNKNDVYVFYLNITVHKCSQRYPLLKQTKFTGVKMLLQ